MTAIQKGRSMEHHKNLMDAVCGALSLGVATCTFLSYIPELLAIISLLLTITYTAYRFYKEVKSGK